MRVFWIGIVTIVIGSNVQVSATEDTKSDTLAGHSYHGEAFNEGPRQKPYLMPGLGQSQFNISTKNGEAQAFFNQGIDQLHGFWYFEAERSFRQVATLEPNCAMAYWGLAMANVNNEERAKKFLKTAREKAVNSSDDITNRESLFISALESYYDGNIQEEKKRAKEYVKKLEEIILKFPDDIEAKAFLACQVWMNQRKGLEITSFVGINSILDDIFQSNPNHPAHHYRIHLWDYENAKVALHSAAQCGPALPNIAHMWHMPGHIYSKLKRYEDAVWQQEASARVDHHHMMHDWVLPDQIHNFAHNNEWCIRNLIHVGRVNDAVDLATNMISLPRHPKYNVLDKNGSSRYGRKRLFQVLSTYECWEQLIDACHSRQLGTTDLPLENIKRLRLLGRAYFRSGQNDEGIRILRELESLLTVAKAARQVAVSEAKVQVANQTDELRSIQKRMAANLPNRWKPIYTEDFNKVIRRNQRNRKKAAITAATKPIDDRINVINRAIDEMQGYHLFEQEKYKEALVRLKKAGEVDVIYRAFVQHKAGETDKAIADARKHVENNKNHVQPLTMLTWLLWECGLHDEATETLCQLRETSSSIDTDAPFFDRLDPVLQHIGIDEDWRLTFPPADDLGHRPNLESLGPFRWQPITAPSWELLDSDDQIVSLSQYSGQPVIVIFYLGHGCLHCAEQLQAFAPMLNDFLDAGIEIVAISSDARDGLKKSIESYGDIPLPIQLLANPKMNVFKQYRTFDEFENQPLHGTFLIDGNGRIRWQDISYEPFMDPNFLLQESQRLLDRPIAR